MPSNNTFQFRRGSGSLWLSTNPVLASGEPGFDFTNNLLKIGNGVTSWSGLNPVNISGVEFNTAVSGLIPVKDIVAGTNISVSGVSGIYTISSTRTSVETAASIVTTVFNKTGSGIPKMTAVYINGGQGDLPTIQKARATADTSSAGTYGITYEAINNMASGRVIVLGALTGLDTDQFNPTAPMGDVNGTVVYLSPTVSGGLTTTKPYAPYHIVALGTIVRTHQNEGIIEVRVQNGYELEELHNVAVTGVTNGQFLQYNSSSGLWLASTSGNFSTLQVSGTAVPTGTGSGNFVTRWIDTNSLGTGLIFDNGSGIGIRTISPTYQLHVNGSGFFASGLAISGSATINGTGIVVGAGTSGYLAKWNGSSTITSGIVYDDGTRIGIGTISPRYKLEAYESNPNGTYLAVSNSGGSAIAGLAILSYAGAWTSGLIYNDWYSDGFVFVASRDLLDSQGGFVWKGNNGTTHMVLRTNGAGKLGLGTTAPLQKFDVRGNVYASGSMGIGGSSYSGNFPTNGLIVQGSVGIGTPSPTGTLHVNGSGFIGGTGVSPAATLHVYSSTSGNTVFNAEGTNGSLFSVVDNLSGALMSVNTIAGLPVFQVNSDYSISGGRFNRSDFVITSGGDIGIGTGIPVAKLHVNGTGIISSRLGIGTTSPQSFIHVSGASSGIGTLARFNNNVSSSGTYLDIRLGTPGNWDNHIFFQRNGVDFLGCSDTNTLYFPVTVNIEHGKVIQSNNNANAFIEPKRNSNNDFRIGFIDGGNLIFMASYVEKMRFTSSGNLGINTASPTAQLHVNGSGYFASGLAVSGSLTLNNSGVLTTVGTGASGYLVKWGTNTSLTSGIIYESGSRIGIGLTNPAYTLQVSGSFGATTKSFNINHPSKPGYRLEYGSLESPYHGVRLTGRGKVVKGVGVVQLPDYLKDLVHDDENLNIQLTNIKHGKVLYVDSINLNDNNFIVKADRAKTLGNLEFFWTLSAVRKDVERLIVERKA